LDSEDAEEEGFFMRNLTSRWSRPEMKNRTARITMMKRTAGLILAPEDEGECGEGDDDDEEDIDSLWNAPQIGGEGGGKTGGG